MADSFCRNMSVAAVQCAGSEGKGNIRGHSYYG